MSLQEVEPPGEQPAPRHAPGRPQLFSGGCLLLSRSPSHLRLSTSPQKSHFSLPGIEVDCPCTRGLSHRNKGFLVVARKLGQMLLAELRRMLAPHLAVNLDRCF